MNQTLVLCKPDAVERGLVGEILGRFESKGLKIAQLRMLTIDAGLASQHYAEHLGKPFYDSLVEFIGRSPAVALVVEGPEDTWQIVRTMMGALFTENLVHGSDSADSAAREIGIFFG